MSTVDRKRLKKLLAEKRLSVRKGWMRCKHGIVLKRGAKLVGNCSECPAPMVVAPPKPTYPSKAMSQDGMHLVYSPDQGVV